MSTEERVQALTHSLDIAQQRIEAIESAMGALVMLAMRQLPADKRTRFGDELAAMAAAAEKHGDMAGATLLTEMHAAVAQTPGA
jgi:hypothetical protein